MIDSLPYWWDISPKDLDSLDPKFIGPEMPEKHQRDNYVFQGPFTVTYSKRTFRFKTPWLMLKSWATPNGNFMVSFDDGDKVIVEEVSAGPTIKNGGLHFPTTSPDKGDLILQPVTRSNLNQFKGILQRNDIKNMKAFIAWIRDLVDFDD